MITLEEFKNKMDDLGYIATEDLLYDAFIALSMFGNGINSGQDIYAMCLEGPPGAGKTEFAKVYTKICNKIFDNNVEMVEYQCDATTGKTELFEDINISAAIRGDADNVNIPGKLIDAIKKVNSGKKVVLFIDEYDKAREETDAFLLQFLQDGKINSTQHGDLQINDEYKSNLQVILCKNDMREELSGPLSRRIRISRLDHMEVQTFFKVATRVLIENSKNKVDDSLINLVTLMYESAYNKRELYDRLPSCSEMLLAIQDADKLVKLANAPKSIIYKSIIKNMFKSLDDIKTFEGNLKKNDKLTNLIKDMQNVTSENTKEDINDLISKNIFPDQLNKFNNKINELQNLIDEYKEKFTNMEKQRKQAIEDEIQKILIENGMLVSTTKMPNIIRNFEDESQYIKRGYDIFTLSNNDWIDIAEARMQDLSHNYFIDKLKEYASKYDIVLYENGILIKDDGQNKIIVIADKDENNNYRFRFMSNNTVIPSIYINDVRNFLIAMNDIYKSQLEVANNIKGANFTENNTYFINTLVYNDTKLNFESISENIYNINISGEIKENIEKYKLDSDNDEHNFSDLLSNLSCQTINNSIDASNKIMNGKRKVLKNE